MARTNRYPLYLLLSLFLCLFPICALAPPGGNQHVSTAHMNLSSGQYDHYHALDGLSSPPVEMAAAAPKTHVIIDLTDRDKAESSNAYLRYMASDCGRPAQEAVRKVTIEGYPSLTDWTLVSSALSKAQHIAEIHWHHRATIPTSLIKSLEAKHPTCKLYYEMRFSNWDPFDQHVPFAQPVGQEHEHDIRAAERESILNSSILYSIKASIGYGGSPNPDDLPLIHHVLITCPNVRRLDLSLGWSGCVVSDGQPYAFDFSSPLANATLPPLEVLKLSGYALENKLGGGEWMKWESSKPQRNILLWPWKYLPDRIIDWIGYPTVHRLGGTMDYFVKRDNSPLTKDAKINLDGWLEHMDWSHVHTLDLKSASGLVMEKLKPVLTELTSLTLEYGGGKSGAAYIEFLKNTTKPLKTLVLRNVALNDFEPLIQTITNRFGLSLKSLELHEIEDLRGQYVQLEDKSRLVRIYDPHIYLNASHISQIAEDCPNLEFLDIDLNRTSNTTVDQEVLTAITSCLSLRDLVLRLESPDFVNLRADPTIHSMHSMGQDPIVDQTFVEDLYRKLRTQRRLDLNKSAPEPALVSLQIFVGAWEDRYEDYGMVGPPRHLMGHWYCNVDAEGRERCEGRSGYHFLHELEGYN